MEYITDQQAISDAAQMLLEKHMDWSGSCTSMPSRDLGSVYGFLADAYLEANFEIDDWYLASEAERLSVEEHVQHLYSEAKKLADAKWQAAMTLLGF